MHEGGQEVRHRLMGVHQGEHRLLQQSRVAQLPSTPLCPGWRCKGETQVVTQEGNKSSKALMRLKR